MVFCWSRGDEPVPSGTMIRVPDALANRFGSATNRTPHKQVVNVGTKHLDFFRQQPMSSTSASKQGTNIFFHVWLTAGTVLSRLIGTWQLVSYKAYSAKEPEDFIYPMGKDCKGMLMYSIDGYMGAQMQEPGQANFSSPDLNGGSEAELADSARRYFGYTGEFYLDESGDEPILKHKMQLSTFPNWLGNVQRRVMRFEGDCLILSPEAPVEILVSPPSGEVNRRAN